MSKAISTIGQDWTPEQLALIKSTVAKNATNDELKLFLYQCNELQLDPLKPGQIFFIKYKQGTPGTIVIGLDGFRSRAARTGKHTGTKRGAIKNKDGKCIGAWAEVYRSDWTQFAREEISLSEYTTGRNNWAKMPETMIKKVAEVAALRMAFPDELGGVYSTDEMEQAAAPRDVAPAQEIIEAKTVEPKDDDYFQGYAIPFGKYKGEQMEELIPHELASYVAYIEKSAEESGKEIKGVVLEFIENANDFLSSRRPDTPVDGMESTAQPKEQ